MAESTLNVTYDDLQAEAGDFLGIGRDPASWSSTNSTRVGSYIKAALARFYGEFDWPFLYPRTTLVAWAPVAADSDVTATAPTSTTLTATGGTPFVREMIGATIVFSDGTTRTITAYTSSTVVTLSATTTVSALTFTIYSPDGDSTANSRMPDAFGGQNLTLQYAADSEQFEQAVSFTSVTAILRYRQASARTGPPRPFAVRPITLTEATGQRWEMLFWPTPDQNYTLEAHYQVLPDATTDGTNYVWGGVAHRNTVIEAVLAEAERRLNDTRDGLHEAEYQKCLQRSIDYERRAHTPRNLGYNGDRLSNRGGRRPLRRKAGGVVSYDGITN